MDGIYRANNWVVLGKKKPDQTKGQKHPDPKKSQTQTTCDKYQTYLICAESTLLPWPVLHPAEG